MSFITPHTPAGVALGDSFTVLGGAGAEPHNLMPGLARAGLTQMDSAPTPVADNGFESVLKTAPSITPSPFKLG